MNLSAMNKCNKCGSTNYKTVIKRDEHGVMRPSGQYQCTGCNMIFKNLDEWRNGSTLPNNHELKVQNQS
jgi:transposase-like protein